TVIHYNYVDSNGKVYLPPHDRPPLDFSDYDPNRAVNYGEYKPHNNYQPLHNFVALFKSDNPDSLELLATELAKLGKHRLASILDFDKKIPTGKEQTKPLPVAVRQKLNNLKTLVHEKLLPQPAQNHSNQHYFVMSLSFVMIAAGAMLCLHNQNYLTQL
ncbi:MAG: hypothetical protein AAF153_01680, partial [Pseudomonadota bacterium]